MMPDKSDPKIVAGDKEIEAFLEESHNANKHPSSVQQSSSSWIVGVGLLLALFAGFCRAGASVIYKYLKVYPPVTGMMFRSLALFLLPLPNLVYSDMKNRSKNKESVIEKVWPLSEKKKRWNLLLVLASGLIGYIGFSSMIASCRLIPASDTLVISALSTPGVAIVGVCFLHEAFSWFIMAMGIFTVVGVGILARPPLLTGQKEFELDSLKGTGFAVACMAAQIGAITLTRKIRLIKVDSLLIVVLCGALQTIVNVGVMLAMILSGDEESKLIPTEAKDISLYVGASILSLAAQVFLTVGLRKTNAGLFSVMRACGDIIFAYGMEYLVLTRMPDWISIVGGLTILTTVFLTVARSYIMNLPKEHKLMKSKWTSCFKY